MLKLIRNEWKKIFLPVLLTTLILSVVMCILSNTVYLTHDLQYDLEAWEIGTEYLSMFFPLFVVAPLCWNLYYERKDGFLNYVMPRVNIRKYLSAKWTAYAFGAFCTIVVPYILSAVFALYVKAPVGPAAEASFSHVFQTAFIETPLLYAAVLSLWRGALSLLVMTLGFVLAMYSSNIFVILTGPFIYTVLENFILSIFRLEAYRLVTAFDPTAVTAAAVTILSFIVGPIVLAIVIGITARTLSRKYAVVTV